MRTPRSTRAVIVAVALLLLAPATAAAQDHDTSGRDRDRHLPTSNLLDPAGQADRASSRRGSPSAGHF